MYVFIYLFNPINNVLLDPAFYGQENWHREMLNNFLTIAQSSNLAKSVPTYFPMKKPQVTTVNTDNFWQFYILGSFYTIPITILIPRKTKNNKQTENVVLCKNSDFLGLVNWTITEELSCLLSTAMNYSWFKTIIKAW